MRIWWCSVIAAVTFAVLPATVSRSMAATSCDTIQRLVLIEAHAKTILTGKGVDDNQQDFEQIERMLNRYFPDAASAAAESSFVAAYYSTRITAVDIHRIRGRHAALAYMNSPSFRMLTTTLNSLQENRNCAVSQGRRLVADSDVTSPNYESAANGNRVKEAPNPDTDPPLPPEDVEGVQTDDTQGYPILPLAASILGISLAAWVLFRLRRGKRPEPRLHCNIVVLVHNGSQIRESTLIDLSRGGCKLRKTVEINKGDMLKIMWAQKWVIGRCRWRDDNFCGILFDTRLSRAEFELIQTIERYDEFLRASDLTALGLEPVEDGQDAAGEEQGKELGAGLIPDMPQMLWADSDTSPEAPLTDAGDPEDEPEDATDEEQLTFDALLGLPGAEEETGDMSDPAAVPGADTDPILPDDPEADVIAPDAVGPTGDDATPPARQEAEPEAETVIAP